MTPCGCLIFAMLLTHQDVKSTEPVMFRDECLKLQFSFGGKPQTCFVWDPKAKRLDPYAAFVVWEMAAGGEQKI